MAMETLTVQVPSEMLDSIRERAQDAQRSIDEEVLVLFSTAMLLSSGLPADIAQAIAPLAYLEDDALWAAARSHFPAELATELQELHFKRQSEGLTEQEAARTAELLGQYERDMLVRAQSMMLLKQRGHDISSLVAAS